MKKYLTLLIAFVATISAFAQAASSSMNFIGSSNYSATVSETTISGSGVKDTLTVADGNTSIAFPSMTVQFMGSPMTIPAMKIANLTYTMTGNPMQGNAVFTWNKAACDTIINFPSVGNKTVKITSLNAVYTLATRTLETTYVFQYGSMPGAVTFTETGYYTTDNSWNLVGQGISANPYRLFNASDFASIAEKCTADNTGKGEYFIVNNDIDFGGSTENAVQLPGIAKAAITTISNVSFGFQGEFDGNNKTISGIYHTNNGNDANGKFNAIFSSLGEGGVVKNLVFGENNSISSFSYSAPFVCLNKGGEINNCTNYASVTGAQAFASGICGYIICGSGSVKNCTNNGNIKAMTYAAGILAGSQSGKTIALTDAGYVNVIVDNCINNGNMSTTNGIGSAGIAGSLSGVVTNCVNNGTIDDVSAGNTTGSMTGGIVSCMTYIGGVSGNVNKGTVKGVKSVGGIIGMIMKGADEAFDVSNNTNEGTIEATGEKGDIYGTSKRTQQTTEINTVETESTVNGKFIENGKIVIMQNGVKYTVSGVRM